MSRYHRRAVVAAEEEEFIVHPATQEKKKDEEQVDPDVQDLQEHDDVPDLQEHDDLPDLQEQDDVPDLPDDVIMDILSRLSAELVLKHRIVCKRWLWLTSSPYFAGLHRKRASPSLLIQSLNDPPSIRGNLSDAEITSNGLELFMFDEGRLVAKRIRDSFRVGPPDEKLRLMGSYDGLLILEHMSNPGSRLELCNLVTGQRLSIETPPGTHEMSLTPHAIFLHGSGAQQEFRMLFTSQLVIQSLGDFIYSDYYIYSLKDKLSWRKVVSRFRYYPEAASDPVSVFLNPAAKSPTLFWMTRRIQISQIRSAPCQSTIIVFDTVAETVRAMPHPVDTTTSSCSLSEHQLMCVYEWEGALHYCSVVSQIVGVWELEDFDNWNWTKKKKINLPETISYKSPSSSSSPSWFSPWWPSRSSRSSSLVPPKLLGVPKVGDGKLVLHYADRLFLLDLKTNKIVTLEQKNMDKSGLQLDGEIVEIFFYTKTLTSFMCYTGPQE